MLRRASLMIALCIGPAVAAHGMSAGRPFSPAGRAVVPVLYLNTDFLAANAGKALLSTNICWANPQNTPGTTPAGPVRNPTKSSPVLRGGLRP